ncbi:hypothetical protein D0T84_15270 [Dysgonomonas sp. 521]|nr:hypothetical protein [Dysgonomonas sp. 521]
MLNTNYCVFLFIVHDKNIIKVQPPHPPGTPAPQGRGSEGRVAKRRQMPFCPQALFPFDKGKSPEGEGLELVYKFLSCTVILVIKTSQPSRFSASKNIKKK